MQYRVLVPLLASVAAGATPLSGQQDEPNQASPAAVALRTCTTLAESGKAEQAKEPGEAAVASYRSQVSQNPRDVEAIVGLARALSQCLLPSANFLSQGELSSEALELLDQAIGMQPDHWLARYMIAAISYRSPAFLGRGKRAAKELDELLRLQGDRNDNPMFARVFAMRGLQLSRGGQRDSARALWLRGAALFPNDVELQELVRRTGPAPAPPSSPTPSAVPPDSATESSASIAAPGRPNSESVESATALAAVQVSASSGPPRAALPSIKEVSRSQVLLTAGGAADVLQAVQLQPGATRVGEGGDVYTRGGDATETALVVNGGRIQSLARFETLSGSMFGAIEPFVVKSVRYYSGGFGARHGNVLSGVLEIETDGRPRERQTRVGISLVQGSATFRTPLGTKAGGWLSGRGSHTAALLRTHGRTNEFDGAPHSQEMIGSFVIAPTPFTELRATAILERDDARRHMTAAGWRGTFESQGDTRAVMLSSRWMSSLAPLVVRGNLAASSRANEWSFGVLSRDRRESSAAARIDAEWQATGRMVLRGGVEQGEHRRFDRGTVPTTSSVADGAPSRLLAEARTAASQVGAYTESEATFGRLTFTAGLRADRLPGESEITIDPRAAIALQEGSWTTRLSGGIFHQGRWRGELAIPDAGTPSGLARRADHLVLGVERQKGASLLRLEGFVKSYDEYRPFGTGPTITGTIARGADILAQRISGPLTGWLGYSFLDADATLENGARVRGAFDITHSATGAMTASIGESWTLGTTVRYGTGAPRTPIVGSAATPDGNLSPVYGALMSERLPHYARVDARLMRYVRLPGALLTTYVEVINAGNRANVTTYTYDASYTSRETVHTFFAKRTLVVGGEFMFR